MKYLIDFSIECILEEIISLDIFWFTGIAVRRRFKAVTYRTKMFR